MRIARWKLTDNCGFRQRAGDHLMYDDVNTDFHVSIHGIDRANQSPDVKSITIKHSNWEKGIGYSVDSKGNLRLGRNSQGAYAALNRDQQRIVDQLRDDTQNLFKTNRG